jgi:hypothetical protein
MIMSDFLHAPEQLHRVVVELADQLAGLFLAFVATNTSQQFGIRYCNATDFVTGAGEFARNPFKNRSGVTFLAGTAIYREYFHIHYPYIESERIRTALTMKNRYVYIIYLMRQP